MVLEVVFEHDNCLCVSLSVVLILPVRSPPKFPFNAYKPEEVGRKLGSRVDSLISGGNFY